MPASEPIQGGPYPEPADPPDGPNQMAALAVWAAGRLVMRFASPAARDAAVTSPVEGMVAFTGTGATLTERTFRSGGWRSTGSILAQAKSTTGTNGSTAALTYTEVPTLRITGVVLLRTTRVKVSLDSIFSLVHTAQNYIDVQLRYGSGAGTVFKSTRQSFAPNGQAPVVTFGTVDLPVGTHEFAVWFALPSTGGTPVFRGNIFEAVLIVEDGGPA